MGWLKFQNYYYAIVDITLVTSNFLNLNFSHGFQVSSAWSHSQTAAAPCFYSFNLLSIWAANIAMVTHSLNLRSSSCWRKGRWWIGKYTSKWIGHLAVSGFVVRAWENSNLYSSLYTLTLLLCSSALCICTVVSLNAKSTHYLAFVFDCAWTVLYNVIIACSITLLLCTCASLLTVSLAITKVCWQSIWVSTDACLRHRLDTTLSGDVTAKAKSPSSVSTAGGRPD